MRVHITGMSVREMMRSADKLEPEDRLVLTAYLKHLARKDDPEYRAELTRLNEEINAGKRFTLEQVERIHKTMRSEGL